jgi:hypothetical protein
MGTTLLALTFLIGIVCMAYGLFSLIFLKGKRIKGLKILVASPVLRACLKTKSLSWLALVAQGLIAEIPSPR